MVDQDLIYDWIYDWMIYHCCGHSLDLIVIGIVDFEVVNQSSLHVELWSFPNLDLHCVGGLKSMMNLKSRRKICNFGSSFCFCREMWMRDDNKI